MARPLSIDPKATGNAAFGAPATPDRRGACPALDAPMQTGDGLLLRLSPASGGLSPNQLVALCESAGRNGNGMVEVTARGSLQFRGFDADSAGRFAEDVAGAGVAVRTGVPVEIGPLAGLEPTEIADPRPLADAIRAGIEAAGLAGRLGPKVSVVVDGGGAVSLDGIAADVRLTAERGGDEPVWRLAIAGGAAGAIHLGLCKAEAAVGVTLAILEQIAMLGPDARGRDLSSELRLNALCPTLLPSVLPDSGASRGSRPSFGPPSRGEIGSFGVAAHRATFVIGEGHADGVISPLVGEMSGRTEGGNVGHNPPSPNAEHAGGASGHWTYPLHHHQIALRIALPFGSATAEALIRLAQAAQALGITDIRPAPMRSLLPICPDAASAEHLRAVAADLGFITGPDIRASIAACPGTPACASGHIAARHVAEKVSSLLADDAAHLPPIHVSGCAKGCARPAPAAITIVGVESGAALVVDGTSRAHPLAYRSCDGLASAIAAAAKAYRGEARPAPAGLPQAALARIAVAFGEHQ
jgi:precorrin-3B synthase